MYLKILHESNFVKTLNPDYLRRPVWTSRSPPSAVRFQRNCSDYSPHQDAYITNI